MTENVKKCPAATALNDVDTSERAAQTLAAETTASTIVLSLGKYEFTESNATTTWPTTAYTRMLRTPQRYKLPRKVNSMG